MQGQCSGRDRVEVLEGSSAAEGEEQLQLLVC